MTGDTATEEPSSQRARRFELAAVALALISALLLAFSNLGKPSLWHDELIHVYVGKSILETGIPTLLTGRLFTNGTLFNYLLAGAIGVFGDGEAAVRSISACFYVVNTYLTYRLLRPLLGGPAAAVSALLFVWSPWSLAWARQARFYMLHQTFYLAIVGAVWKFGEARSRRATLAWGAAICVLYGVGLTAGPQTIFFLGPIGAYAACRWYGEPAARVRWSTLFTAIGLMGAATLLGYYLTLPKAEHDAIFKEALAMNPEPDGLVDHGQTDFLYYFRFYTNNLSSGYFVLACAGFAWMLAREGKRGLLIALAFIVPLLILNFGIVNHRRFRFLFFAYPFYVAASGYAIVQLAMWVRTARQSTLRLVVAVAVVLFAARTALSTYRLIDDCIDVAKGADTTLAVHHPAWRQPCAYVKDHLDGAVVVSTTFITAHYYVGRLDNWYPSRVIVWEYIESGMDGMKTLDELKAYVKAHPKGFFLAEWRRFGMWPFFKEDLAWVDANMRKIEEASNRDITLYAWGIE